MLILVSGFGHNITNENKIADSHHIFYVYFSDNLNTLLNFFFLRLLVTGRKRVENLNMEGGFTCWHRKGEHTLKLTSGGLSRTMKLRESSILLI